MEINMEINNPGDKHIACVLLVDTSTSMNEKNAIDELNEGLKAFGEAVKQDAMASGCADVCVIRFSSKVEVITPFSSAQNYTAPQLSASGMTAMNEAIITALDAIEQRKAEYRAVGVDYWRPWLFLLTDGYPTDTEYEGAARQRLTEAVNGNKINFFPMGIGPNADLKLLKSYTAGGIGMVLRAEMNNFREAFVWLSKSISVVANSNSATSRVDLPKPSDTISITI